VRGHRHRPEKLGEPSTQRLGVEDPFQALLDAIEHHLIEVGQRDPKPVAEGRAGGVIPSTDVVGYLPGIARRRSYL